MSGRHGGDSGIEHVEAVFFCFRKQYIQMSEKVQLKKQTPSSTQQNSSVHINQRGGVAKNVVNSHIPPSFGSLYRYVKSLPSTLQTSLDPARNDHVPTSYISL